MYESASAKTTLAAKIRSETARCIDRNSVGCERWCQIFSIFTTTSSRGSANKTGALPRSWTIAFRKSPYSISVSVIAHLTRLHPHPTTDHLISKEPLSFIHAVASVRQRGLIILNHAGHHKRAKRPMASCLSRIRSRRKKKRRRKTTIDVSAASAHSNAAFSYPTTRLLSKTAFCR
jgi:hypothetical protein